MPSSTLTKSQVAQHRELLRADNEQQQQQQQQQHRVRVYLLFPRAPLRSPASFSLQYILMCVRSVGFCVNRTPQAVHWCGLAFV